MKGDTQTEPLFRLRTDQEKKKEKREKTWHETMFLTHNVVNVS